MSATVTGLQGGTQYCFDIAPILSPHVYNSSEICTTTTAAPTPVVHGIKTVQIWNCESNHTRAACWYFDHTVGGWHRAASAPTSWTANGCGPDTSSAAASVDLPDQHQVTIAEVIVDGTYCKAEDPNQTNCLHWESSRP